MFWTYAFKEANGLPPHTWVSLQQTAAEPTQWLRHSRPVSLEPIEKTIRNKLDSPLQFYNNIQSSKTKHPEIQGYILIFFLPSQIFFLGNDNHIKSTCPVLWVGGPRDLVGLQQPNNDVLSIVHDVIATYQDMNHH